MTMVEIELEILCAEWFGWRITGRELHRLALFFLLSAVRSMKELFSNVLVFFCCYYYFSKYSRSGVVFVRRSQIAFLIRISKSHISLTLNLSFRVVVTKKPIILLN